MSITPNCLAIGLPGGWEWIIVALFGLLLFGKRLPDVGKSLGKSIVEFKKGLRGIEDDIDKAVEEGNRADMLPPPDEAKKEPAEADKEPVAQGNSKDTPA